MTISRADARRIAITHQGLHSTAPFGKGKRGVFEAIAHLGYVQIDTISVTERAHDHVLWSRVPNYSQKHLHDLQVKDRQVLEFWAHAAAFLPMRDYRYTLPTMEYFRNHHDPWPKSDKKTMQWVIDRIKAEGALKSRDFEAPENQTKTGWWDWKPAKIALQRLFFSGDIIVSHREGFQRVYDLTERVIPSNIDSTMPSAQEYARYLVLSTLRAHGIGRDKEMAYLRRGMGGHVRESLKALTEEGAVLRVQVKHVPGEFYTLPGVPEQSLRVSNAIKLLSPFDNSVIQRNRLSDLFDFDYQIECYVPKPKRKYGYYCLPILRGDRFIGRVDVKADRSRRALQLVHLVLDDGRHEKYLHDLAKAVFRFAAFNSCESVELGAISPTTYRKGMLDALKQMVS